MERDIRQIPNTKADIPQVHYIKSATSHNKNSYAIHKNLIYIQGGTGGMCQTSGGCSLC